MKVILTKSVTGRGPVGTVLEVTDAYARNYLFPRGLARLATSEAMAGVARKRRADEQATAKSRLARQQAQTKLAGQSLHLQATANDHGRLFASLKADAIIQAIEREYRLKVAGATVEPAYLKTLGVHPIELRWPDGERVKLTVVLEGKKEALTGERDGVVKIR